MEERILTMLPLLNEKQKRFFLATEAMSYGHGGIAKVSQISGVSLPTIRRGIKEIKSGSVGLSVEKLRVSGAGRKNTLSLKDIQCLLLSEYSIDASYRTVGTILDKMGYSKQQNQKMLQVGKQHPDRNEQFEFINSKAAEFLSQDLPPYGVYVLNDNTGFINLGTAHDTTGFAVASILRWEYIRKKHLP